MNAGPQPLTTAKLLLFLAVLLTVVHGAGTESLDIAVAGYGLSIGNSKRFTGLRINAVDADVERITGVNLTLWNPRPNPEAAYNGLALGLIGTKAARIDGIALGGIGVNARQNLRGLAAGTLGVGAGRLTGVAAGLITVDIKDRVRGIVLSGFWTGACKQLDGLAISPGIANAANIRGATLGLIAGAEQDLTGVSLALGGFYAARLRGLAVGGFGGGAEKLRGVSIGGLFVASTDLQGIACSLGGIGGKRLDGIVLAGLGLGASERIRGVAIGGLLSFAPEVTGLSAGALNGLYIDRVDLEDFLHVRLANERFTGLSIGLVNYTARLKGVQLGLLNYAGNNPRWLRLLPLVNVHV
jgi:hypothetical protein